MADYTEQVTLPSKGALYPGAPELSGPITLRMMTTEDEKKIFGSSGEDVTRSLLKSCIVSPNFDPDDLVPSDRHFLLMKLRIFSYGPQYHVEYTCNECGAKGEVVIDLNNDLPVYELPDGYQEPREIKLPRSGRTVGIKTLTLKEINQIRASAKKFAKMTGGSANEREYMLRQIGRIALIDGKEEPFDVVSKFVSEMPAMDSAFISREVDKVKLGYDYLCTVKCGSCGQDTEAVFTPNTEFFRPRFD